MRAPAVAVLLLAFACCALGGIDLLGIPKPFPADLNLFPAGLPTYKNPYAEPWYVDPPLPPNSYRGAYVSAEVDKQQSENVIPSSNRKRTDYY